MNKKDYKTWNKATKTKFLKLIKEHQDADRFIQGKRLQNDKINGLYRGCFFGCLMQTGDNTLYTAVEIMKLPAWIVCVAENIFEGLSAEEAVLFPLQLAESIPTNKSTWDTYRKRHRTILCDPTHGQINYAEDGALKEIIQECHDIRLDEVIDIDRARSATRSARSAMSAMSAARSARSAMSAMSAARSAMSAMSVRSAVRSAESARSVESAVRSARSAVRFSKSTETTHYQRMRDTLISLMGEL